MAMTDRRLVRVQEKGQVTLPADVRKRLGIKKGDLVAVIETEDGVLITRQEIIAARALDRIGDALRERGLSLDEMIDSGRDVRSHVIEEQHGLRSDDRSD